jgi:hypothetical protein
LSSILKALKRIEAESPPPQTYASLPKQIDSKQALNTNTLRRRRLRRILNLSLILLLVAGAAVILFSQRRHIIAKILPPQPSEAPAAAERPAANQPDIYRAKVPSAPVRADRQPPTAARKPLKPTSKTLPASDAKKFQASTGTANRRLSDGRSSSPQPSTGTRPPQTAPVSRKKQPLKRASTPPRSKSVKKPPAQTASRPTASAPRTTKPVQNKPRTTYDRLDDAKLKLQALAWSEDIARRMAVINGLIVREGESVDGYQVIKIREEDVIVRNGAKSWRLEFGLQH